MFSLGVLTFFIIYGILMGFFVLGTYYAKLWCNVVFSYLLKNTSPSVQQKFKKPNKSKKLNAGPLKDQQKRKYSSGKKCLGLFDKLLFRFPRNEVPSVTNSNNLDFFLNKIEINSQSHKD